MSNRMRRYTHEDVVDRHLDQDQIGILSEVLMLHHQY